VLRLIDPADAFKEMLNGIEFTQLVRSGKDGPDVFVPIIMVTGYGDVATVTSARDAGVTEFLIKPISAKTLYLRVLEAINKPRSFIRTQSLFGPNRRRQVLPFKGPDRRVQAPMEIPDADHVARLYPINPQE
jgi:PleD family two-component response regulator